ncbi:hypothetical protein BU15DRAFT_73961 [Melanogaster broomeanus]|nr:hypothetical protein BU15DRAFT_73961 [Melanogaster broomeanus]
MASRSSLLADLTMTPSTIDKEKEELQADFDKSTEKLIDTAKCVPDDKEELEEEKQMWMKQWNRLMDHFVDVTGHAKSHGMKLQLSTEAGAAISMANEVFDQWAATELARTEVARVAEQTSTRADSPMQEDLVPSTALSKSSRGTSKGSAIMYIGKGLKDLRDEEAQSISVAVAQPDDNHPVLCDRCARCKVRCYGTIGKTCDPCMSVKQACSKGKAKAEMAAASHTPWAACASTSAHQPSPESDSSVIIEEPMPQLKKKVMAAVHEARGNWAGRWPRQGLAQVQGQSEEGPSSIGGGHG